MKTSTETEPTMSTWHTKAHRVIAALCRESYEKANRLPNGRLRKRHVPYTVPQDAETLIKCLAQEDEITAKGLFQSHAFGIVNR